MNHSAPEPPAGDTPISEALERNGLLAEFDELMYRAARVMSARFQSPDAGLPLSAPQYMVLKTLEHGGPMRGSDIATHMGVTNPAVSMLVQALEEQGLLDRAPDPSDRRATIISVSKAGAARVAESEAVRRVFMERMTGKLDDEELAGLIRSMNKLIDAVSEEFDES